MLLTENVPIPALAHARLSANCFGLTATTATGEPASLAIIDGRGAVLESGAHVARAAWLLMCAARNNFLEGEGHLRVCTPPQ